MTSRIQVVEGDVTRATTEAIVNALLASCYRSCLELAAGAGVRSIAFPAISAGVYRFPLERATRIAVEEVVAGLRRDPNFERVEFVCFGRLAFDTYSAIVAEYANYTE